MRRLYDRFRDGGIGGPEEQHTPADPYDEDATWEESPLRRILQRWGFGILVVGVAALVVIFFAVPSLLDWWNPRPTGSSKVEVSTQPGPPSVVQPPPATSQPPLQGSGATPPPVTATGPEAGKPDAAASAVPTAKPEGPTPAPSATAEIPKPVASTPLSAEPGARESKRPVATRSTGQFWIQVGAFNNSKYAQKLRAKLAAEHYSAVVRDGKSRGARHLVWVGGYPDRQRAEEVRADLQEKGFAGFILRDRRR